MATKKTSTFTLTERLAVSAANAVTSATIDLGSYVDVGDRQGLMIHSVDYVLQGTSASTSLDATFGGVAAEAQFQVLDLNRGDLTFANDRALVSSGRFLYGPGGNGSMDADIYPDNYGPNGSMQGRIVVNDQLYCEAICDSLGGGEVLNVTVRINASIVTLSAKDFMAIAIQSTAADN